MQFIGDAARFYACQFVIATHSPFLLSMKGTKIYDLDEEPVDVKRWTQLENVRAYYGRTPIFSEGRSVVRWWDCIGVMMGYNKHTPIYEWT